jgi:diguanylate cyclase (GGDEF)-like protein
VNALETRLLASPSLPTLPRVAQRVLELARRDDVDLGELARAIGTDPALATKLLRLINSPMYHMTREVTSLRDAALYLGMNAVKNVALSFSLIHKLRGGDSSDLLDALWRASLMNALAARKLAAEVGGWDPEEAFLIGLIADSGVLVLLKGAANYPALLARFLAGERDLLELERAELDTDHTRISWLLLQKWGFPERTRALIAAHHNPDAVPLDAADHARARVLSAAWLCARALSVRGFSVETASLDARLWSQLGIAKARALALVTELPGQLREAAAFFDIPAGEQLGFPELLEEANSRLADAALASERESTELAAAASAELEARTRELAPPLDYDDATGMVSESSFETLVQAHQQRARRRRAPLSVLAVEIAALKQLAAGGGAAAVNAALRELGARTVHALRPTDPSGRVGGDRIGAILPGCSTESACAAAQRLRLALERAPIALRGQTFQVNVAIGVAGLNGDAAQDERSLLSSALAALDRARGSGEPISR